MVKTSPPNAGGAGLIPGQRDKMPHTSWPKKKKKKKKIEREKENEKGIISSVIMIFLVKFRMVAV